MRILLATYWHVPHLGGVWPYMEQLKMRLEAQGHHVDTLGYGDIPGSFVHMPSQGKRFETHHVIPLLEAKLNASLYPSLHCNPLMHYNEFRRYAFELAVAAIGIDSYDLIHTQDVFSTVAINRLRSPGTALVATIHGCVAHEMRYHMTTDLYRSPTNPIAQAYYNRIEQLGGSVGEYTVLANQWMKTNLTQEFGVPAANLKVIHYGYDIPKFMAQLHVPGPSYRPPGQKVITYTGRLTEIKGLKYLLGALARLRYVRQDWVCWLIGDGDGRQEVEQQCHALGLGDKVCFWGARDDIPSMLAQSDLFVLPSLIENQPMSVIEAQLAGKAIITSDAGGLPEMTRHRKTGLLFPVGDEEKLLQALQELLADDRLREKLGSQVKEWAHKHWSLDSMTQSMSELYEKAVEKRKRAMQLVKL